MAFKLRRAGIGDRTAIMALEKENFEHAMSEESYLRLTRKRGIDAYVAESNGNIVAYIIYELRGLTIYIYRLVVSIAMQRMGIGTGIINTLKSKLANGKKHFIHILVHEQDLRTQLFLRKNRFICTKIMKSHFDNGDSDGYVFKYQLPNVTLRQQEPELLD